MSLLDDVSIVVTPNGYKAGELYAVIPSNGDADMDVTRATAATRVDENGLVNYAEILGGEEVTNGDFATDLSGWTGQAGRGSYAWDSSRAKITNDDTSGYPNLSQSVTTVSGKVYKVNATVEIGTATLTEVRAYSGGVLGSQQLNTDGTIDFTFTAIGTSFTLHLYLFEAGNTGNYCFFDNVSVKEVTRDNVPRIDYTGGGCPHILAEPQRTNLFLQSEDFTSEWSTSDATITANSTISPDGTQNASTLTTAASGGTVQESLSISDGDIAFSLFVKKGSTDGVRLRIDASTDFNGYFDLTDGTIHSATGNAKIEPLDNDWYKISVAASVTSFVKASIYTTDGTTSYDNGTVFIWGAQLEEGSYATSYIPTSGSTVTRNQDIFTRDGIGSLINSTEGVLFWEGSGFINGGSEIMFSLSDGTSSNVIQSILHSTASRIIFRIILGGVNTVNLSSFDISQTENLKIALKWKENDFALWVNGVEKASLTSGSTFLTNTINELNFSDSNGASNPFFGKVKQLQVYKTALTDTQLAALTS